MTQRPPTSATCKAWSYHAGEKGRNRVRVFERGALGLWIEYPVDGRRKRRPLGHSDRDRAKQDADGMAVEIGRGTVRSAAATLRCLTDLYLREVTPLKPSQSARGHDRRTIPMLLEAFGANRRPDTLNRRDWDSYITRRRRGELVPGTKKKGASVRARIIEQDLKLLLAILNWAERSRDGEDRFLLERNPLRGLRTPKEESPRRPRISLAQFSALALVAAEVSPLAELFVWTAWCTGHRAGGIRRLCWNDLDLDARVIRWRGGNDKIGYEHETPMHQDLVAIVEREHLRTHGEGATPVLPESDATHAKPMSREDATDLWAALAKRAEIPKGERYGWHAFRRAFANQLRDVPLRELDRTRGGWKNEQYRGSGVPTAGSGRAAASAGSKLAVR